MNFSFCFFTLFLHICAERSSSSRNLKKELGSGFRCVKRRRRYCKYGRGETKKEYEIAVQFSIITLCARRVLESQMKKKEAKKCETRTERTFYLPATPLNGGLFPVGSALEVAPPL